LSVSFAACSDAEIPQDVKTHQSDGDFSNLTSGDLQVLQAIKKRGDDLTASRDVVHYTYFLDEEKASKFAEDIKAASFIEITKKELQENKRPVWLVEFHDNQSLLPEIIGKRLSVVRKLAELYDGEYDGWEAAVIAP